MGFSPRKSAPSYSDKHWIYISYGGYNKCILISGNSCLPNCVGYAWGRWLEESGKTDCRLSRGNARDWYNYNDGYPRGQQPKVGAVMCFGGSGEVYGHVAIVEEVWSDGTVVTSNSGYGGPRFYLETIRPPYRVSYAGAFQGFIYNPDIDGDTPSPSPEPGPSDKFNIGDEVILDGPIYASSDASSPANYISDRRTNITRKNPGSAHPYNTTGDLGWCDESSLTKVEPAPAPEPSTGLSVGDDVEIIGTGNGSSYGDSNTAYGIGWHRQILRIWDGRPYPYQVGNGSGTTGFYQESSLRKI